MGRGGVNWTDAELACHESRQAIEAPKPNKYLNVKKECDGILFDSGKEARAYIALKAAVMGRGTLERQVPFVLQEKILGHRAIKIVVDFMVTWADGRKTVYEVKSKATKTPVFAVKCKLFAAKYPEIEFIIWE